MFWRLRDILYICDVKFTIILSNTNLNKVEDYARF